jgi:phosphatidylglycerophosphatase A
MTTSVDVTPLAAATPQPTVQFMLRHSAHIIAFSGGAGLVPVAPGTFGTLLAFPIYDWLSSRLGDWSFIALLVGLFALGIWACGRTGRALGVPDHGALVWDETIAFLLVLFFTPAGWGWQVAAFFLFRFFDIAKPAPIRAFDRKWKNGFGVMFDDVLAAGYTLLVLAIIKNFAG